MAADRAYTQGIRSLLRQAAGLPDPPPPPGGALPRRDLLADYMPSQQNNLAPAAALPLEERTCLSKLFSNRAAARFQLAKKQRYSPARLKEAVADCTDALLLAPRFVNARLRRARLMYRLAGAKKYDPLDEDAHHCVCMALADIRMVLLLRPEDERAARALHDKVFECEMKYHLQGLREVDTDRARVTNCNSRKEQQEVGIHLTCDLGLGLLLELGLGLVLRLGLGFRLYYLFLKFFSFLFFIKKIKNKNNKEKI